MSEKHIFHLVGQDEWNGVNSEYRPESLEEEGFIHFCEKNQIETVLEFEEEPRDELVVLCVDRDKVEGDLKYENGFPHLYRALRKGEVGAVKKVDEVV